MINTTKELCYRLKIKDYELDSIIKNLNRFYYEAKSTKTKYGGPQIEKGNERKRPLHPSIRRLKQIQEKINQEIFSKLAIPDYAFGSVKGKDNISNAQQHTSGRHFFSVDLKSFFPSINNHMVYDALIDYKFSPDVSRILTRLTTYKGVLPQGTPTSPMLANLVFVSTGQKLVELIGTKPITFTSFLDDFTFSSKADFKFLIPKILRTIKKDGYWFGHKKISYKTKEPEVTGITILNGRLVPHHKILLKQKESNNRQLNFYVSRIENASRQKNQKN